MKPIPKITKKNRNLVAKYTILMTPEMKLRLEEAKTFKNIDISEWIRTMIEDGLNNV